MKVSFESSHIDVGEAFFGFVEFGSLCQKVKVLSETDKAATIFSVSKLNFRNNV